MSRKSIKVVVHGRVQGVAFRHYTKVTADNLGLFGWVKNLRDGTVAAAISGPEESLTKMVDWLHHGPDSAIVQRLEISDVDEFESSYDSFEIHY